MCVSFTSAKVPKRVDRVVFFKSNRWQRILTNEDNLIFVSNGSLYIRVYEACDKPCASGKYKKLICTQKLTFKGLFW